MVNAKPICILHFIHPVKWKKVREVVKTCHIQTFQKKSTSGKKSAHIVTMSAPCTLISLINAEVGINAEGVQKLQNQ